MRMITRIKKSRFTRAIAIVLAFNILGVSSVSANAKVTLNAGTSVVLETTTFLKSELLTPGQSIDFKVKYNVFVDGNIVINAGTIAKGQIVRTQIAKGLGKPGYFEVRVNSVTSVDGQAIPLTGGNIYKEGEEKQTEAIVLGVLICILFLTMKGKNAEIPAGSEIVAVTAGTVFIEQGEQLTAAL